MTYYHKQTKIVNSMYGKVYLTARYDYNHSENYVKITKILKYLVYIQKSTT